MKEATPAKTPSVSLVRNVAEERAMKKIHQQRTPGLPKKPSTPLVGHYFHSLNIETGKVEWQGNVIGNPEPGWYLVQLFDYIVGYPSVQRLMRIEDMSTWLFYEDAEEMKYSYEEGTARPGGPYRDRV